MSAVLTFSFVVSQSRTMLHRIALPTFRGLPNLVKSLWKFFYRHDLRPIAKVDCNTCLVEIRTEWLVLTKMGWTWPWTCHQDRWNRKIRVGDDWQICRKKEEGWASEMMSHPFRVFVLMTQCGPRMVALKTGVRKRSPSYVGTLAYRGIFPVC